MKSKMKSRHIIFTENVCFFGALIILAIVDWRLAVALFLYNLDVCSMILRYTEWKDELETYKDKSKRVTLENKQEGE